MSRELRRQKRNARSARRQLVAAQRPLHVRVARVAWSPGNRLLTTAAVTLSLGMAYGACTCTSGSGVDLAPLPGTVFYTHDHLGGPTVLTDTEGRVVGEESRDPWGAKTTGTDEPRQFADAEFESETGLYYMGGAHGGRYYDPRIGRFLSVDPAVLRPYRHTAAGPAANDEKVRGVVDAMRDPQVLNPYSYARNSPASYYDPSGEEVETTVQVLKPVEVAKEVLVGKARDARVLGYTWPEVDWTCRGSCSKRADKTFGFDATADITIHTAVVEGMGGAYSKEERGITINQHEKGHAEDLVLHFSKERTNQGVKTEGFTAQRSCESARKHYPSNLKQYTEKGRSESYGKRGDNNALKASDTVQPSIDRLQQP
jgi:RHS repeat-associated protein